MKSWPLTLIALASLTTGAWAKFNPCQKGEVFIEQVDVCAKKVKDCSNRQFQDGLHIRKLGWDKGRCSYELTETQEYMDKLYLLAREGNYFPEKKKIQLYAKLKQVESYQVVRSERPKGNPFQDITPAKKKKQAPVGQIIMAKKSIVAPAATKTSLARTQLVATKSSSTSVSTNALSEVASAAPAGKVAKTSRYVELRDKVLLKASSVCRPEAASENYVMRLEFRAISEDCVAKGLNTIKTQWDTLKSAYSQWWSNLISILRSV